MPHTQKVTFLRYVKIGIHGIARTRGQSHIAKKTHCEKIIILANQAIRWKLAQIEEKGFNLSFDYAPTCFWTCFVGAIAVSCPC